VVGKTPCFVGIFDMKTTLVFLWLSCVIAMNAFTQENLELYRGNKAFDAGNYEQAKTHYQNALKQNPASYKGTYNSGNANYKEENFEGALSSYQQAVANSFDPNEKAQALHNLGNAYLKNQKLDEGIKAYKDALRINPNAEDTRYNLAFAQKMKQKQQQDQQKNDQKDQENKEEQDKNDQQKNDDQKKDENKDQQQQENNEQQEKNEENKEKPEPKPSTLSERDAEQMLDAAKNDEQKVLLQLNQQKQKANPKTIDKDW